MRASTASRPILDMRIRPPFLHRFFGSTPGTPEYDVVRWLNQRVGSKDVDHFASVRNAGDLLLEMDRAKISVGVIVARNVPGVRVTNDEIAQIVATAPARFVGVGLIDPQHVGKEAAVAEIHRAVTHLGCKAINVDPGFLERPVLAYDEVMHPVYDACSELGIPVSIMSGPTTSDLSFAEPRAIARVAKAFPKLRIIVSHGGYPFVSEMIAVALMHPNIFVSPDMYAFMPGGSLYVEAANGFMRDQLLFGTSYPFKPLEQGVEDFLALGFRDDVLDRVMWANAAELLGVKVPSPVAHS